MRGKYQAAFIIPFGSHKVLCEDGWEFESSVRLHEEIKNYLIQSLKFSFLESYLGIESYSDGNTKMSVIYDDQNEIESIHFQLHDDFLGILYEVCKCSKISSKAELFIPSQW